MPGSLVSLGVVLVVFEDVGGLGERFWGIGELESRVGFSAYRRGFGGKGLP